MDRKVRVGKTVRYCEIEDEDCFDIFRVNSRVQTVFGKIAEHHGVTLIPILWAEDMSDVCSLCDGLIITGSDIDVDPSYFDKSLEFSSKDFDEYHYNRKIITHFFENDKPILGICSGLQELNIYFGGDVVQDMDGHYVTRHDVTFEPDTWFSDVYDRVVNTNSYHHQCVGKPAPALRTAAVSGDEVIEAMDYPGRDIIGFQWHPEVDQPELRDKLFAKFFEACRKTQGK